MTVIGFLAGQSLENADFADPAVLRRSADAVRRLHVGPALHRRLRHVRPAGRLPRGGARPGHRPAAGLRRPCRRPGTTYAGRSRPHRGRRCRATTTCSRPTTSTTAGGSGLADRLRVLRQQRRLLRAGQHHHRVRLLRGPDRRLVRGLLRRPRRRRTGPGCGCRRCAASTAGRCGASSRRPRARSTTTSTRSGWSATRRPPRRSAVAGCRGCWSRWPTGWLSLPARAQVVVVGGGVVGCSVAYHLTKLGWTDVLLLEQGQPLRWHHLARRRAGRTAAGQRVRHPAGAVLRGALRLARGRDRAGDRLPQRRAA